MTAVDWRSRRAQEERRRAQDRVVALPRPRSVTGAARERHVRVDAADAARVHVAPTSARRRTRTTACRSDATSAAPRAGRSGGRDPPRGRRRHRRPGGRARRRARAPRGSPHRHPSCRPRRGRRRAGRRDAAGGRSTAAPCRDGRRARRPSGRARPCERPLRCRDARPRRSRNARQRASTRSASAASSPVTLGTETSSSVSSASRSGSSAFTPRRRTRAARRSAMSCDRSTPSAVR